MKINKKLVASMLFALSVAVQMSAQETEFSVKATELSSAIVKHIEIMPKTIATDVSSAALFVDSVSGGCNTIKDLSAQLRTVIASELRIQRAQRYNNFMSHFHYSHDELQQGFTPEKLQNLRIALIDAYEFIVEANCYDKEQNLMVFCVYEKLRELSKSLRYYKVDLSNSIVKRCIWQVGELAFHLRVRRRDWPCDTRAIDRQRKECRHQCKVAIEQLKQEVALANVPA